MVFQAGQSGNPGGSRGRKPFIDALNNLITQEWNSNLPDLQKGATIAHAMAHKLVKGALRDDWKPGESLAYLQEICDRAYGKSQASVDVNHKGAIAVFTAEISPITDFLAGIAVSGKSSEISATLPSGSVLSAPIRSE